MLKFIRHLFLFLAFAMLFYIVAVVLWAELDYRSFIRKNVWYELEEAGIDSLGNVNSYGHMFSRMKEVKTVHDVDILFVGGSQAYRGFDSRIFSAAGYKTFNMGSSNQTPLQTEILLERYLKSLNPHLVVYVVYPEVFSVDGVESSLDLLANDKVDFSIAWLVLKQRNLKLFNTMLYAGYRECFGLNKKLNELYRKGDDTYVSGGYVEKDSVQYLAHKFNPDEWHFVADQFKAFERTLQMMRKKDIPFVLVQTPTVKPLREAYPNNDVFDKMMQEYGPYYNFNKIIHLNDSLHFYDPFHMNQEGVELFDNAFIQQLLLHAE